MIKLLYIGNNLRIKTSNISAIQTLGPLFEKEGFKVYYASSKVNKVLRLLDMLWTCLSLSTRVDVVCIDTYSTSNFYYAWAISQLCRALKLKYVPILHGGNLPYRLEHSPRLSKQIFRHAHINVSPSLYFVDEFKKKGFENVVFIPNSIEIENYPFRERSFKTGKLLWVRSFSKIYNPELAIQILADLKHEPFLTELCMVGPDSDGSMVNVKERADQLGCEVSFPGKLTKQEWIGLSEDFDIFINTTNYDNMPVSVIEAMALGLLVISTNVGGIPYLISEGQDGILVPPKDASAFTDAIKKAISNSENSKRMTHQARQKVEAYNWNHVKKQWLEALT